MSDSVTNVRAVSAPGAPHAKVGATATAAAGPAHARRHRSVRRCVRVPDEHAYLHHLRGRR